MSELLIAATEAVIPIIDMMALIVIVVGTVEAFVNGFRAMVFSSDGHEMRTVWLRFGRWLVAGLTFQLASDIVETSIAPTWQDIGRLAAIAVIRTFLNYFLERDLEEIRRTRAERGDAPAAS